MKLICVILVLSAFSIYFVYSDIATDLPQDWSYCFEFTWFGPEYTNISGYNGTCADYLDNTRATDVPCAAPIVITYDGTPPDIDYLFEKHTASVLCRRSASQACVKYSYLYNGEVENATYMCAKVQSIGEGSVDSGCYTQSGRDGYEMEMCVCKSGTGVFKPCNSQATIFAHFGLIVLASFVLMYLNNSSILYSY